MSVRYRDDKKTDCKMQGGLIMYRDYEDPRQLEAQRDELKLRMETETDTETLISMHETLMDLEQRINHAWADEEWG